ncbi:hypothetical protein [Caudoviricetes sp.]|nr:hypothetical protein [Caudoviricetes sp.]UOF78368.1 hypothetical protein [Bacteriophage sp.]
MATLQELSDFQKSIPQSVIDAIMGAPFGRPLTYIASINGLSPSLVSQFKSSKSEVDKFNALAPEQKSKIEAVNKILSAGNNGNSGMQASMSDVLNNPDLTPQQLANKKVIEYWSNESEAFSRVINAANTSPEKLKVINTENGLALTTGEHPGYDTLYLNPTGQPNVYNFTTYNQKAGGNIHGVIGVNPDTGAVSPVVDAAKQFAYTPGSSGSFLGGLIGSLGDIFKDLGPIGVVLGNLVTPGLGTALGVITAIDEGADIEDIAKNVAIGEIVNQVGVGTELTDSTVAADLVDNTLKGLLTGQDLDSALTNAVVSSVASEVSNQTPDDFQADVEDVLDSPASTPVSDYIADINDILDMPATNELVGPSAPEPVSGQDLAADAIPGNTIDDIIDVLPPIEEPQLPPAPEPPPEPPAEPGLTKSQVEALIKTALAATAADQVINQPETKPPGFDIVPVPTDWSSPVYDQSFTPVDLDSIFQNLQDTQIQWKPRPNITGGAFMGSPVNISDIVNNIMSAELTPQAMPTNITNAVGGILGSTTTR